MILLVSAFFTFVFADKRRNFWKTVNQGLNLRENNLKDIKLTESLGRETKILLIDKKGLISEYKKLTIMIRV